MGRKCVALGCTSSNNGKTSIMFHKFPQNDPERFAKWLELCPPDLNIDKGRILLCSRHFHRDQYLNFNDKKPKLVHNAVPFKKRGVAHRISKSLEKPSNQPALIKTSYTTNTAIIRIPLEQNDDIEYDHSADCSADQTLCELYEDPLVTTVEVNMKDSEPISEDVQEEIVAPTAQATYQQDVILENIHLKVENEKLRTELASCKQRLSLLEKHVQNLSTITDSLCVSCTNSLLM